MSLNDALFIIDEYGYIQDIGQLRDIRKDLNRLVRQGKLYKCRMPWLGCLGPDKTTYYRTALS